LGILPSKGLAGDVQEQLLELLDKLNNNQERVWLYFQNIPKSLWYYKWSQDSCTKTQTQL